MFWVIENDPKILGNADNFLARTSYIEEISGGKISPWIPWLCSAKCFWCCTSSEGVNGLFVTAHVHNVTTLIQNACLDKFDVIVANTCKCNAKQVESLLSHIRYQNPKAELLFAKQDGLGGLYATVSNTGTFGFATTESEREFYRNCVSASAVWMPDARLRDSLHKAFEQVDL